MRMLIIMLLVQSKEWKQAEHPVDIGIQANYGSLLSWNVAIKNHYKDEQHGICALFHVMYNK